MQILLGDVGGATGEDRTEGALGGGDGVGDGDGLETDAEVAREVAGVVLRVVAGNGGGQRHADDVVRAEGGDGELGDQRGVDAAGERDEGALETAFVRVVAQAEDEGGVDVGEGGRGGRRGGLRAET